jgi:hypothetical protein
LLDVLITVSETTPKEFVEQCRASVHVAALAADFPIRVIETPGVPGHIGQAMARGFEQTSAPYVAWVDDDDFVLPPAFACLAKHFAAQPQAIYTRELHWWNSDQITPYHQRHHLAAFRRDVIDPAVWFAKRAGIRRGVFLGNELQAVDEPSWVYVYRIRESAGRALRWEESRVRTNHR